MLGSKKMYYIAEDVQYLDAETAIQRRQACEYEKK